MTVNKERRPTPCLFIPKFGPRFSLWPSNVWPTVELSLNCIPNSTSSADCAI